MSKYKRFILSGDTTYVEYEVPIEWKEIIEKTIDKKIIVLKTRSKNLKKFILRGIL